MSWPMANKFQPATRLSATNAFPGGPWLAAAAPPPNRLTLVLGRPGAGKTVLALQILACGARRGESSLFVSFAPKPAALLETAARFGWDLAEMEKQNLVLLLQRKPPRVRKTGRLNLGGALAALRVKAAELGARRIIFDGLDQWLPFAYQPISAMEDLYRLRDWLYEHQFAGLVTVGWPDPSSGTCQALLPLAADCTIWLSASQAGDGAARHMQLAKCRGFATAQEDLGFVIGQAGIEVIGEPHERPATAAAGEAEFTREVAHARSAVFGDLRVLDRFLELKQAELDFRLAQQATGGT